MPAASVICITMPPTGVHDAPMRKVILTTLNSDPTATFETVLSEWRYRRHQILEAAEESRLRSRPFASAQGDKI